MLFGQMTFRNGTECWFVKTWRRLYRKCYRNRVRDASCNLVLFGPIKGREKPLLIANWRQKTTMPSEIARTAILNWAGWVRRLILLSQPGLWSKLSFWLVQISQGANKIGTNVYLILYLIKHRDNIFTITVAVILLN